MMKVHFLYLTIFQTALFLETNALQCHREEVRPLMLVNTSVNRVYVEPSEITSWSLCFWLLLNIWKISQPII